MKKKITLIAMLLLGITAFAQEFSINPEKSEIKWTGKKVTGQHWGYIQLKNGELTIQNDKIVDGEFNIDMNSIICKDLEDEQWNKKLVGHLKSDDFFSVDKYPVSTLKISEATAFKNDEANVKGNLTIKGITHPISFTAKKTEEGYMASITVDRTKYNIRYGSGKFFDNLGDNMIYDDFTLHVKITLN